MRNLKKILALVLALVMSLSLMATASAADFTDKADIDATGYQTAVDVLAELGVVRGYENGSFQPNGDITRAEVAAIIYRIATKDVKDTQAGIYTTWGKFADVKDTAWYAGYVNYCANAEIVKGKTATTFDPEARITGYQVLAMILRTMGYGKNGEFEGDNWAINTAAQAKKIRIIDNILEQKLGDNATRAMVAEILFNALLTSTVEYNALTGYVPTGKTLGQTQFGLEKLEGVVMANEYASLTDSSTLAAGKTQLKTASKTYTLNTGSTLDDIGEYRYTYVIPASGSRSSDLVCTGLYGKEANTRWETTDYADISSASKFSAASGMSKDSKTEEFINFASADAHKSTNIRIKYVLTWEVADSDAFADWADVIAATKGSKTYTATIYDVDNNAKNPATDSYAAGDYATEEIVILPKATVSQAELDDIESIFNWADTAHTYNDGTGDKTYLKGEVYVGTQSYKDISDEISFEEFVDRYLTTQENSLGLAGNDNGNWMKAIDNNGDGVAEYLFKVVYTVAQVAKVKGSTVTLDVKNVGLDETGWTLIGDEDVDLNDVTTQSVHCNYDDPAAGDVVYYAVIDKKVQAYKAEIVPAVKIDKVNRNTLTATVDGTDYVQSDVHQHIQDVTYEEGVRKLVVSKVTYDLFLDRGGYLAAFVKSELGGNLVLLTDGWFMAKRSGDEYAAKVYNRDTKELDDTDITSGGKQFIDSAGDNNQWGQLKAFGGSKDGDWTKVSALNNDPGDGKMVRTIVAALDEDGNLLPVDSDSVYTRTTKRMVAVDKNTIVKDKYLSGMVYTTDKKAQTAYDTPEGKACEIRALTDTVYYYVYPSGKNVVVREYVGYGNTPNLTNDDLAKVEDVYAVGTLQDRESGYHGVDYYTADVVVVEFKDWKAAAEAVFVYDFPVVSKQTKAIVDDVQLIDSTGEAKSVTVDLTKSEGFDKTYDPTETKYENEEFRPGLYWLYATAEDGVYALRALKRSEISKTNFVVGQIATTRGTGAKAYTEVGLCEFEEPETIHCLGEEKSSAGYAVRYLTDASQYYTLTYGSTDDSRDWASYLEESDWETTLSEKADVIAKKDIDKYTFNYGKGDPRDIQSTYNWHNRNEVLMLTKSNGDIIWAVSFERLAYRGYYEVLNQAYYTWINCLPEYVAPEVIKVAVDPVEDTDSFRVKWNGGAETIDKDTVAEIPAPTTAQGTRFTVEHTDGMTPIGGLRINADGYVLEIVDKDEDNGGLKWTCVFYKENKETLDLDLTAEAVAGTITVLTQDTVDAILAALADEATAEQALAIMKGIVGNDEVDAAVKGAEEAAADEAAVKQLVADVIDAYKEYAKVTKDESASETAVKEATDKLLAAYGEVTAKTEDVMDIFGEDIETMNNLGVIDKALEDGDSAIGKAAKAADDKAKAIIDAAKSLTETDDIIAAAEAVDALTSAEKTYALGIDNEGTLEKALEDVEKACTDDVKKIQEEAEDFIEACSAWYDEDGMMDLSKADDALAACEKLSKDTVDLLKKALKDDVSEYKSETLAKANVAYAAIQAYEASKPVPAKAALKLDTEEAEKAKITCKWDAEDETLTVAYTGDFKDVTKLDKEGIEKLLVADDKTAVGSKLTWKDNGDDTFVVTFAADAKENVTGTDSITVTVEYKSNEVKLEASDESFKEMIDAEKETITVGKGATVAQLKECLKAGNWEVVNTTSYTTTGVTDTTAAADVVVKLTSEYGETTIYKIVEEETETPEQNPGN